MELKLSEIKGSKSAIGSKTALFDYMATLHGSEW